MDNNAIKVIQHVTPIKTKLTELLSDLKNNEYKNIKVDVLSTNYNNSLILKDKHNLYYLFPVDECVRVICGRHVDNYHFTFVLCAHMEKAWPFLSSLNLNSYETYKLMIEGEYDIPGTAGEKTRSINGVGYVNLTKGFLYEESGRIIC